MKKPEFIPDGHFSGPVSSEWLPRAVPLTDAWHSLGAPNYVEQAEAAARWYADAREGEPIDVFLFNHPIDWRKSVKQAHGLLWGEALDAFVQYYIARQAAQMDIEGRLGFGNLFAFGDPERPGADPVWIPVRAWRYLRVDWTKEDRVSGEGASFWFVRVVVPPHEASASAPQDNRGATLPPFDVRKAVALLTGFKHTSRLDEAPSAIVTAEFLRHHFRGIPSDKHVEARRLVWKEAVRRGRKKRSTAN